MGGDLLHDHDVMPRMANRQIVIQKRGTPQERVAVQLLTMATLVKEVGRIQDELYRTPVWHDMARKLHSQKHLTGRAVIPPGTMKAVPLRYISKIHPARGIICSTSGESLLASGRTEGAR